MITKFGTWYAQKGEIKAIDDLQFYYEMWQAQPSSVRFGAMWKMFVDYHQGIKGFDESQLRLQRSVATIGRTPG